MRPALTRLLPAPSAPTTVVEAYDVTRTAPPDRPWVGLCMITSLDGSVSIDETRAAWATATTSTCW